MFPGFATIYKDNDNFIHLYFFNGIDDDFTNIYRNLDLSELLTEYKETHMNDGAIDYIFTNKTIKRITVNMVHDKTNKVITKTLTI